MHVGGPSAGSTCTSAFRFDAAMHTSNKSLSQIHQRASAFGLAPPSGWNAGKNRAPQTGRFQQATTAPPTQLAQRCDHQAGRCGHGGYLSPMGVDGAVRHHQFLILPMASGFRPLGHTSTQFMMVWQRNRRYGSSRLSRRSGSLVAAVGDEAIGLQQTGGPHELVRVPPEAGAAHGAAGAQEMHSYRPLSSSRSSGDCRRSFGNRFVVDQVGA